MNKPSVFSENNFLPTKHRHLFGLIKRNKLDGMKGVAAFDLVRRRFSALAAKLLSALCMVAALSSLPVIQAEAQTTVNLASVPILALKSAPGLVMLTISRDHRLFYAAYNDTSDIDGDGVVDVGFKPGITYYGNFVSDRCYDYITSGPLYRPAAMATATGCKAGTTQRWHGNWLNWATTSRMDALRRVLYGGYRVVDPASGTTVLQGAFIPKDSHVWGKEFRPGRDTYDITQYTTLTAPASGKQHLFVVVSPGGNSTYPFWDTTTPSSTAPVLRYVTDADQTTERIWLWASADVAQGIGSSPANFSKGTGRSSVAATDRTIRVEACVPIGTPGVRETGCTGYPTSNPTIWKPTGTLHDYSVNDQLKFGLITGSYQNNYSGGVLRRNIGSFSSEIVAATGQFATTNDGIARTIDRITIHGWAGSQYDCGYKTDANRNEGDCKSWGAPVGEMMYEGLRYFSGKSASTSVYSNNVALTTSADSLIGFSTLPAWLNPYRSKASGGNPICSRPVQMVIADPLTSFDSDQLPGSYFSPTAGFGTALSTNDLTGLNVSTDANAIWSAEGLGTRNIYIGQSGGLYDGNPTAKSASSFAQIRGHAPDETQSQGSFYSAAVASFGRSTFLPSSSPLNMLVGPVPATPSDPANLRTKVDTLAVALGSLTPKIEFPNPSGGKVSIVPLSKAVGNAGIDKTPGKYQATGAITGFYYANYTPTSVSAVVNFSDSDQGTDNETDAQVRYDISISGANLTIAMTQLDKTPGGIQSNMGYVISGTTKDGLYLETRNNTNGSASPISAGEVYYLDTLPGQDPAPALPTIRMNGTTCPAYDPANYPDPTQPTGNGSSKAAQRAANAAALAAINSCLPSWDKPTSRTFTLSSTPSTTGSFLPHDPLWYAAKYGGAGLLDANGDPTNYFKISNPAQLPAQMGKAFRSAAALAAVASTSVVGVGQRSSGSAAVYQANYDSLTWSSRLYGFQVGTNGLVSNTPIWEASSLIGAPAARTRLFLGRGGSSTPFQLTAAGFTSMTSAEQADFGDVNKYAYLLGDKSKEERNGGVYRNRGTTAATGSSAGKGSVIGDIVNSDPQIINKKDYGYGSGDATYTGFLAGINYEMLAVGTNNGFFHIFDAQPDASGGGELLGFMPQAARTNVKDLSDPGYAHRNFVDGPTVVGHAKITLPGDAADTWHSVVVGSGGGGVQTVFAINASSTTFTANSILWEINSSSIAPTVSALLATKFSQTFGKIVGRPVIGKLGGTSGKWVAIFGNGYNSTAGTANLYVVDLKDGTILKIIPTSDLVTANGLGSIEGVRKASDNTIDYVYGADYKGNIWRFDPNGTANGALIYSTPTGRPITAEIRVGDAPASPNTLGGKMIYFGTGSYLNSADVTTIGTQALYGIYDGLAWTDSVRPSVAESTLSSMSLTMPSPTSDVRSVSAAPSPEWYKTTGKNGWVVPLTGTNIATGERVIAPPVRYTVAGLVDAFLFTSLVPSTNECEAGLDTWITGVDAMTGGFKKVFLGLPDKNSVRIRGGSPRGVFVLENNGKPSLYISQTVFNSTISTTTFGSTNGGIQDTTIGDVTGETLIKKVDLDFSTPTATTLNRSRQIWRQLK